MVKFFQKHLCILKHKYAQNNLLNKVLLYEIVRDDFGPLSRGVLTKNGLITFYYKA